LSGDLVRDIEFTHFNLKGHSREVWQ